MDPVDRYEMAFRAKLAELGWEGEYYGVLFALCHLRTPAEVVAVFSGLSNRWIQRGWPDRTELRLILGCIHLPITASTLADWHAIVDEMVAKGILERLTIDTARAWESRYEASNAWCTPRRIPQAGDLAMTSLAIAVVSELEDQGLDTHCYFCPSFVTSDGRSAIIQHATVRCLAPCFELDGDCDLESENSVAVCRRTKCGPYWRLPWQLEQAGVASVCGRGRLGGDYTELFRGVAPAW